jgi:Transposase IS4
MDCSLVSHVPKKGRQVTLLSSMHHDTAVSEEAHKKTEMISYYNKTKYGVDRMDQMVPNYACKRKINRWSMTFFFNMIDVAGIAASVVWITKNPSWNEDKSHRRRLFL